MADPALQDVYSVLRVPLVNVAEGRQLAGSNPATLDLMYMNCFPTVANHPVTGESEFFVQKRPGLSNIAMNIATTIGGGASLVPLANIGFTQLSDVCVAAFFNFIDTKIYIVQYRPSAGTSLVIGSFAAGSDQDKVYLTEVMTGTTFLPSVAINWCKADFTTSEGYYATSSGGITGAFTAASLNNIVDANYPANVANEVVVGHIQQLNGYFYAMGRSGKIYQCQNVYNVTAWSSNRIIDTYSYPDKGVGIVRYKNHLVAFSDTTIEFFNDSGARGDGSTVSNSLERTEQAFIKFGAVNAKCIRNIDDVLYWIAASDTSTTGVWRMDGYTPIKISTFKEDALIQNSLSTGYLTLGNKMSLECLSIFGTKHIIINDVFAQIQSVTLGTFDIATDDQWPITTNAPAQPRMLAYSLESKAWWFIGDCNYTNASACWLPCAYFDRNESYNYYNQFILKFGGADASLANQENYIYNLNATSFQFYDQIGVVPALTANTQDTAVPIVIQSNTLDQTNNLAKFLKRLEVVQDAVDANISQAPAPNFSPYTYIMVNRNADNFQSLLNRDLAIRPDGHFQAAKTTIPRSQMLYLQDANIAYTIPQFSLDGLSKFTIAGWFRRGQALQSNAVNDFVMGQANPAVPNNSNWLMWFQRSDPNWIVALTIPDTTPEGIGSHFWSSAAQVQSGPFWTDWVHIMFQVDLTQPVGSKVKGYMNFTQVNPVNNSVDALAVRTTGFNGWIGEQSSGPFQGTGPLGYSNVRLWKNQIVPVSTVQACAYTEANVGADWEQNTNTGRIIPVSRYQLRTDISLYTPTYSRTYLNNVGQTRRMNIAIAQKSPYPARFKALELTMMQGR